ncbi:DUF2231 domain-containing protein [Sulfurimonas autotrophica]|uniref:DUF2231 domain-containing protein n=1 Tax=Sulfurimonas autotrophica (strain ATCC BAA-671 / DSM 16294 / JCM 11897 / OK10) TaxID=563040 RepID=E0URX1_SULAO|nr:hypothetical protein [Sulfurimonas autotrophica]ADN10135.1 conserved hypothetical protein [Sulfurimonas autotrophica DSM 16294]
MMLHPATVHFAMVLPLVASVFGLAYLYSRTQIMSKISARATLVAALAMIAVWYTGSQAGPQIFDYLSEAGQHELKEHKELGLYLAIAMGIIALIQMAGCKLKKFSLEVIAILLLLGATATTFLQGKHGGEIVYNYGMPFKSYMIEDSLHEATANAEATDDCDEKVEAYEDAIDDITSLSEDVDTIYGNTPKTQEDDDE